MALSAASLIFDPETHTSRRPDGLLVPHVTTILAATGVSTDFEALALISPKLAESILAARDLGRAVHADCHALDDDDLVVSSMHPTVAPYVNAWEVCRASLGLTPVSRERQLYHGTFNYTGIMDGIFKYGPKQWLVLIDLKIGDPDDAAAHLQTAAYEEAWKFEHPDRLIKERWAVQLTPDRRVPYVVTNYSARQDAWRDFQIFMACLTVYNNQPERRPRC